MSADVAIFGSFIAFVVCLLVFWVISIIAYWKLFTKAGEQGWKSIIPVYSEYSLFKIAWNAPVGIVYAIAMIVYIVLDSITQGSETTGTVILAILSVVAILMSVLHIIRCFKLSKAYGHGGGYAAGLIFFYPIFILILGLGSSKYVGNQG